MLIIKQAECSKKYVAVKWIQKQNIPDDEGEESGDDEDIIKHGKCNEEPVESLLELFPLHNKNSDGVAWKSKATKEISNKVDDYQEDPEHRQW